MWKIIWLKSANRYFRKFDCGNILTTHNALEAKKFIPRDRWYNEKELNEVLDKLDENGTEYDICILDFSVRKL